MVLKDLMNLTKHAAKASGGKKNQAQTNINVIIGSMSLANCVRGGVRTCSAHPSRNSQNTEARLLF